MEGTEILSAERYGYDFVPPEFLPPGKDEYWLRNSPCSGAPDGAAAGKAWRPLTAAETEALERNGNFCRDWSGFLVSDPFDPSLVRNSSFHGLVRLGAMRGALLRHHDFCLPVGIYGSRIISCDIGDDAAIQNCAYISHYVIGDGCMLSRVDEMQATNHAKFGNGAIKDGEAESVRVWIDVMNEGGGRSILPFEDMLPADAFLWAAYRDDDDLTGALKRITQERYGGRRGSYGTVGERSVIKSCAIIKDVAIGAHAYIKGANKLKNLTILSSREEPTQIGEGVEMVNGIVGHGCRVFYGSKAVRFVMGRNCNLKYGARLVHSVMGDNSTVSCCELLNNLIFPMHEQHHNNSFLIASLVQGMSNMAAAATIGSNHNSRANDGELRAKRGFWPGLAVSLKHPSCFASFVLIAKGEYPAELSIPLPFSLVSNNVHKNRLELMPAYYWRHNLYALERTSWKVRARDRRVIKAQRIETDYLAPDTAEEIIGAIAMLEGWLAEMAPPPGSAVPSGSAAQAGSGALAGSAASSGGASSAGSGALANSAAPASAATLADAAVADSGAAHEARLIPCRHLERSKRGQVILSPNEGLAAYRQMLRWYAAKTLAQFLDERPALDYAGLAELLGGSDGERLAAERVKDWVNMGGQIAPAFRVDRLRSDIGSGKLRSWDEIHAAYGKWSEAYPLDRARHAWAVFFMANGAAGKASAGISGKPDALALAASGGAGSSGAARGKAQAGKAQGGAGGKAGGKAGGSKPAAGELLLRRELAASLETRRLISRGICETRAKDFRSSFRKATFRSPLEMERVLGRPEDDPFARHAAEEERRHEEMVARLMARLQSADK